MKKDALGRANLLMMRGWGWRQEGNLDEAYRDMLEAIALFRQTKAYSELVTALGRLGHITMDVGRYDEARVLYEEAIQICRQTGDTMGLAHKTRHLGDVHRHCGRAIEASSCYEEALSLYRTHHDPPKLDYANAICMAALLKEERRLVDDARRLWSEAKELYQSLNLQQGVDECTNRLAALGS